MWWLPADLASRDYFPHLWFVEGLKYLFVAVLYSTLADPYMEMGGIAGAMERASSKKKEVRLHLPVGVLVASGCAVHVADVFAVGAFAVELSTAGAHGGRGGSATGRNREGVVSAWRMGCRF
jgi:hypothetical protein